MIYGLIEIIKPNCLYIYLFIVGKKIYKIAVEKRTPRTTPKCKNILTESCISKKIEE